MNVLKKKEKHY